MSAGWRKDQWGSAGPEGKDGHRVQAVFQHERLQRRQQRRVLCRCHGGLQEVPKLRPPPCPGPVKHTQQEAVQRA